MLSTILISIFVYFVVCVFFITIDINVLELNSAILIVIDGPIDDLKIYHTQELLLQSNIIKSSELDEEYNILDSNLLFQHNFKQIEISND